MRPAAKVKHPKGFGTDKERHHKKVWYEVACREHGMQKVSAPKRKAVKENCPLCRSTVKRAVEAMVEEVIREEYD